MYVQIFRVLWSLALESVSSKLYTFIDVFSTCLNLEEITSTIYYKKNANYIARALNLSGYRPIHEKNRVIKLEAVKSMAAELSLG